MDETLRTVRNNLYNIIVEVESIAQNIETGCMGVGEHYCANSLRSTANLYRRKLSSIDLELAKASNDAFGGGGGGGRF